MSGGRRRDEAQNFMPQMRSEIWSAILKWSKLKRCAHMAFIYSLSVTQNWREIWISSQISLEFEIEFVEPISLIMISEFYLWFSSLIQDQVQESPLSVLRCHEAFKARMTCVATYPSAGERHEGSRVRLPREEGVRSCHQRLFEENVRKTGKVWSTTLIVKGSGVVFTHGKVISTSRVRHKGRQPSIKCANMTSKLCIFPLFYVFLSFYAFCIF